MNELQIYNGVPVISSRDIAEKLNKQHKHVLESIHKLLKNSTAEISALIFESEYLAINGKSNKHYLLTKDGFTLYMFNIQGHNDFKLSYIQKFNEMEEKILNPQLALPHNYEEALEQLLITVRENNQLKQQLELKNNIVPVQHQLPLEEPLLYRISDILTNMGAKRAYKELIKLEVIYIRNGQYKLYAKYKSLGEEKRNSSNGYIMWNEKGRAFLIQKLG